MERISLQDVNVKPIAADGAGLLAKLGNPMAFSTIQKALDSDSRYTRGLGIDNLIFFIPLHGQTDISGKVIDVWSAYRQALQDESIQLGAKMQLQELGTPEALELLER